MQLVQVVGKVVSSVKEERLRGSKLLLVQATGGEPYVAVDTVGAGTGELVLVVTGSPAMRVPAVEGQAVDAVIIGIVDAVERGDSEAGQG